MSHLNVSEHVAGRFTPRYFDWLTWAAGVSDAHWQLVAQAAIGADATVLEIGVGTGNVLLKVKRAAPHSTTIGLDSDLASLAFAARKATRADVDIQLDHGDAGHLPYPDATFDRVLSSFVIHHICDELKPVAMSEVRRVLKPGGSCHFLDFVAITNNEPNRFRAAFGGRHNHGPNHVPRYSDPMALMDQAGLIQTVQIGQGTSLLGRHAFYRATR
jgi:ubiquinone/menaquinone biosynthesis C-methylase UbiE